MIKLSVAVSSILGIYLACLQALAEPIGSLTLEEGVRIAIQRDQALRAVGEEASALREQSIAASQLPDPMARLGAAALPADSLALDEEPMTQLELGLAQRFPPGRSRQLAARRLAVEATVLEAAQLERVRYVAWQVELAWRELDYLERALALLEEEGRWLDLLVGSREAGYAAGTGEGLAMLDARIDRAELEERKLQFLSRQDVAAVTLGRWIGEEAVAMGRRAAPGPAPLPAAGETASRLAEHPSLLGLERAKEAAQVEVTLVEQRYRPSYGLELGYGFRVDRPDMLSAMLTFDLPVFTRNRQDRERAAALSRARAAEARQEDKLRDFMARLAEARARERRLAESESLYLEALEPLVALGEELSLAAYASDAGELPAIVATRRRALDLRERLERLRLERGLAAAEIRYLIGELP